MASEPRLRKVWLLRCFDHKAGYCYGQYLERCDFEAFDGLGHVDFTIDPDKAKRFDSVDAAAFYLRTVSVTHPKRWDGKPNRPLTATSWGLESHMVVS